MLESTILLFALAVSVVLVTSLLKMPWLGDNVKVTIATVTSVVAAAVHTWVTGDFEAQELIPTSLQILGGSQLIYKFLLDDTKLDDTLSRVGTSKNYDEAP